MPSEPTVELDPDTTSDVVAIAASRIDWYAVTEAEAAAFGKALGQHRAASYLYEKRRVAWGTALGGTLGMAVLAVACVAVRSSPWFALSVVVVSQTLRTLWLYWQTLRVSRGVTLLERQVVDVARQLVELHPHGDQQPPLAR